MCILSRKQSNVGNLSQIVTPHILLNSLFINHRVIRRYTISAKNSVVKCKIKINVYKIKAHCAMLSVVNPQRKSITFLPHSNSSHLVMDVGAYYRVALDLPWTSERRRASLAVRGKWLTASFNPTFNTAKSRDFTRITERCHQYSLNTAHCCLLGCHAVRSGIVQVGSSDTRAETRFRLSVKRTSPCDSAGATVQSTTAGRGV
jgi:hypothetical protein